MQRRVRRGFPEISLSFPFAQAKRSDMKENVNRRHPLFLEPRRGALASVSLELDDTVNDFAQVQSRSKRWKKGRWRKIRAEFVRLWSFL